MSKSEFWNKGADTTKITIELKELKKICKEWNRISEDWQSLFELVELIDESDKSSIKELETEVSILVSRVEKFEFRKLLNEKHDKNSAIITIHSGAGGTEACDWVEMLLRMYVRWSEKKGYEVKNLDLQSGDEAGIKSVTSIIEGRYAFGYLKSERGVHRLVRISPFDSNKRRHTSFASVNITPEIEDDIEIEVKNEDLRIDTFRASGPGGQHVNTADSAVRITHMSTGTVVQSQNERSQHRNKNMALKVLKSKLFELEEKKREEELKKERGKKKEIAWGSQIRSYVFHPYNMVKDHRTNIETGKVEAVMDGDIDMFIEGFLKWRGLEG